MSGKDTAAGLIPDSHHLQLKTALYATVGLHYRLTDAALAAMCTRERKEVPAAAFGGLSPRQALIHVAEDILKPRHGSDYFARITAAAIGPGLSVVSDCGFQDDVDAMERRVGPQNVLLIRLHRRGRTYAGDSRSYVTATNAVDIANDASLEDLAAALGDAVAAMGARSTGS
jgi:hypothetical protein